MKQQTLAMAADQGGGFEQYRRPTKRYVFLETMEQIVPWAQRLCRNKKGMAKQGNLVRKPYITKQ
jgi:IS5 family transposase